MVFYDWGEGGWGVDASIDKRAPDREDVLYCAVVCQIIVSIITITNV